MGSWPGIERVATIQPMVREAVGTLEELCDRRHGQRGKEPWVRTENWWRGDVDSVAQEVRTLVDSPKSGLFLALSAQLFEGCVKAKQPTLYFSRSMSPEASVLFHVLAGGQSVHRPLLDGCIREEDFPRLTTIAAKLACAPLGVCDAQETDVVLAVLFEAEGRFRRVMCDWPLTEAERTAVRGLLPRAEDEIIDLR